MMVINDEKYSKEEWTEGYKERLGHVALIADGARCYMIMCEVKDPASSPRAIKSYDDRELRLGGELIQRNGITYIKLGERIRVSEIRREQAR